MRTPTIVTALLLVGVLADASPAQAESRASTSHIEVRARRIHTKEILAAANPHATIADVDLGATPPIGASRLIERAEIERAYADAALALPKKIPLSIRVSRKTRRLTAVDVGAAIRTALGQKPLPRGATLTSVHAAAMEVADDFHHMSVELPVLPRRAGPVRVPAVASLIGEDDAPLTTATVAIDLSLPPQAAFAEIAKGASLALLVRKGLIEISTPSVALTDADIGSILPVAIKPSGRVLRARAVDKDHAIALDDS